VVSTIGYIYMGFFEYLRLERRDTTSSVETIASRSSKFISDFDQYVKTEPFPDPDFSTYDETFIDSSYDHCRDIFADTREAPLQSPPDTGLNVDATARISFPVKNDRSLMFNTPKMIKNHSKRHKHGGGEGGEDGSLSWGVNMHYKKRATNNGKPFSDSKSSKASKEGDDKDFCTCTRCECSKNYCSCKNAGRSCGERCKCSGCTNCVATISNQPLVYEMTSSSSPDEVWQQQLTALIEQPGFFGGEYQPVSDSSAERST